MKLNNEHAEFVDIINKWGGTIRYWKNADSSKFDKKFKLVDYPQNAEIISKNDEWLQGFGYDI